MVDRVDAAGLALAVASDPGAQTRVAIKGHMIVLTSVMGTGFHTGRHRFCIACSTCEVLLHEATTGPGPNIERHLREASRVELQIEREHVPSQPSGSWRGVDPSVVGDPYRGDDFSDLCSGCGGKPPFFVPIHEAGVRDPVGHCCGFCLTRWKGPVPA